MSRLNDPAPSEAEPPSPVASPSPTTKREALATLTLVGVLVGAVLIAHYADRIMADATPEQCEALLDRYVAHRARAVQPEIADSAIATQQLEARDKASTSTDFADCPDRVTQDQVDCAMRSNNADEFERCLQ